MKNVIKISHEISGYLNERTVSGITFFKVYVNEMQSMIISCILDTSLTRDYNVNL